ncbi:13771_t:CDS:1, partial [Funneliformis geosporum]
SKKILPEVNALTIPISAEAETHIDNDDVYFDEEFNYDFSP